MSDGSFGSGPGRDLASADRELTYGQVIGEYVVKAKIGEGGFGTVYRAEHPVIGKLAAIKVLSMRFSADATIVSRFVDEARAVNQINHRNIIDIFSFGSLPDGRFYYVMELLEGEPLDRALQRHGRFSPEQAIRILAPVARALDAAHEKGIVHRDLKPENVFLAAGPDHEPFPKLLDFGIAKLVGDTTTRRTQTGVPIGTPYYMSPEQCRGTNVDHRTDVYSFGVMAYELIVGRLPFEGETHMDLMTAHVAAPIPRPSELCPGLASELDGPMMAMLAKRADDRPRTVSEAIRGLGVAAKRAGFSVDSAVLESRATPSSLVGGTTLDSHDRRQVESAPTIVNEQAVTTLAAESPKSAPAGNRTVVVAVGGALAVVAVAAVVILAVIGRPTPAAPAASAEPVVAPPVTPSAAPVVSTVPSAPATPSAVALTVDSKPARVTVKLGDRVLGVAPGPLELPYGTSALTLTFDAPGHKPRKLDFTPEKSGTLTVELERATPSGTRPSGGPRGPSDLEF